MCMGVCMLCTCYMMYTCAFICAESFVSISCCGTCVCESIHALSACIHVCAHMCVCMFYLCMCMFMDICLFKNMLAHIFLPFIEELWNDRTAEIKHLIVHFSYDKICALVAEWWAGRIAHPWMGRALPCAPQRACSQPFHRLSFCLTFHTCCLRQLVPTCGHQIFFHICSSFTDFLSVKA